MILEERIGDLFSYDGLAIGHGVNCRGLMGAGIAAEFKRRWPEMYEEYRWNCQTNLLPGGFFGWQEKTTGTLIINLATQDKPGPDARIEWVRSSLMKAALALGAQFNINTLAIPRIGCGIGGLIWKDVKEIIESIPPNGFKIIVYVREEDL